MDFIPPFEGRMDLDALLTQWFPQSDFAKQREEERAEAARAAERPKDDLTYEDEVEQQFAAGTWEEKADPEGKKVPQPISHK